MINVIVGTFVGFNLVFIECLLAYGFWKKKQLKKINRFSNNKK